MGFCMFRFFFSSSSWRFPSTLLPTAAPFPTIVDYADEIWQRVTPVYIKLRGHKVFRQSLDILPINPPWPYVVDRSPLQLPTLSVSRRRAFDYRPSTNPRSPQAIPSIKADILPTYTRHVYNRFCASSEAKRPKSGRTSINPFHAIHPMPSHSISFAVLSNA